MVNRWVDDLRGSVAGQTVAIYWRNLRPFFSWWARETDQPNPFAGADVPSAELNPPDVIHLDDIRKLLETCKGRGFADRRDTAVIRVLFDTGCRRGELIGLTIGDWDRRQDFLTLRGKTGMRVVPISASTGEALARYLRARGNHAAADKTDALWLGGKGALGDSGVSQLLARRCREAGLERLRPHQFRHTFSHEFRPRAAARATSCTSPAGRRQPWRTATAPAPPRNAPARPTAASGSGIGCNTQETRHRPAALRALRRARRRGLR
jgi:site-specific recombinase XerD